jgi:formylglycine-generating enzyme required for sulfatase activity
MPAVCKPPGALPPEEWSDQQWHPDRPVVEVSWHDAATYANFLAQTTGEPWRLSSEAEWEKAARGIDERIYPWGNAFDLARANTEGSGMGRTTPVGCYPRGASPFGVQDIVGTVMEWTNTTYQPYPYQAGDGREDRSDHTDTVLRGGGWNLDLRYACTARRDSSSPATTSGNVGVRLVQGSGADGARRE